MARRYASISPSGRSITPPTTDSRSPPTGKKGSRTESGMLTMSKRIVIIDDSIFLIKQLTAFFEVTMGYKVVATGCDGSHALPLYTAHKPDLITLDITMPHKDGVEALT